MRWEEKRAKQNDYDGETRIVSKFLLFPRKIGSEWRWWENAKIEQRCSFEYDLYHDTFWEDIRWVNE